MEPKDGGNAAEDCDGANDQVDDAADLRVSIDVDVDVAMRCDAPERAHKMSDSSIVTDLFGRGRR